MNVTYHFRKHGCAFSIEQVFADVRNALPPNVVQSEFFCPHRVATPLAILKNCQLAKCHVGEVNHITGEVHYLAMALPRRGLVLTIHDTGDTNAFSGWKKRAFDYLWFTGPIKRAQAVTFISESSRVATERLIGRKIPNAVVIPDPVSPAFQFEPKEFPQRTPRILCLGTKVNKNLERLAEALRGMDVELRLIGEPTDQQAKAFRENNISLSMARNLSANEVAQEYRDADIVSLVSTFEGFGLPIVEGQAMGRVVVTSNIDPMSDTAGGAACLVDPLDILSIRAGFERVISNADARAELIEKGRVNAQRFSAETIAGQYAMLYRRLLDGDQNHE